MPKNLEIKARILSVTRAIEIANSLKARLVGELYQTDTYFRSRYGRLKLREIENQHSELIFYDRNESSFHRVSEFHIFPVQDPAALSDVLNRSLGLQALVEKKRHVFLYDSTRIHIDEVIGLGSFIEFEVPIVGSLASATQIMGVLIKKFEIKESDHFPHSYADMALESVPPASK